MERYITWIKRIFPLLTIGMIIGCASNMQRGEQAELSGDYQAMLEYCTKATKEKNPPPQAFRCIGDAQSRLGNRSAAENAYITYLELVSGDTNVRLRVAEMYINNGNNPSAQMQIEKILEQDTSNFQAYYLLGEIHRISERCKNAKEAYDQSLNISPNFEKAKRGLEKLSTVCKSNKLQITNKVQITPKVQVAPKEQITPQVKKEETFKGGGKALQESDW